MYRLVVRLLEPYTFLIVLLALSQILVWRRQRPRGRALIASTVVLGLVWTVSMPMTAHLALGSLEWSYPPGTEAPAPGDTIVVLGGDLIVDADQEARLGGSTFQRCHHAQRLYQRAGGCRIIVSGGKPDWAQPGPTLAEAMRDFFLRSGVRTDDLILEDKSATTFENACRSRDLLETMDHNRVWLVTDAVHMNRAERCFRLQGVDVTSAPCDHQTLQFELRVTTFLPAASAIAGVNQAAHEWLGLLWYRLRGRA